MIVAFLLLLLLHNALAMPLLVRRKKPWAYVVAALVLLAAFAAYVMLLSGIHGGPPPDGPGGPGGPGPIRPEVLMILVAFLLLAANAGLVYWVQERRSAARIRELEAELKQREEQPAPPVECVSMVFRSEGQDVRVEASQIRYVEGMSEYVKIWRDGEPQPLVVLERLKNLETSLPAGRFLRVHRSYIVNLDRVRATGAGNITLDDGTHIPVGDSYRDNFRRITTSGKTK